MSARKWLVAIAAFLVVIPVCAGCGVTHSVSSVTVRPVEGGSGEGYPLVITNCGQQYTFTQAPQRVVVMNGGSVAEVESLLALGLGDRIVANAQSYGVSDVPGVAEQIAALPTAGIKLNNLQDIPREAMLSLQPDFVISTYDGGFRQEAGLATRKDLLAIGANSYAPHRSCGETGSVSRMPTIEDSYRLLRDLGSIFGVSDKAEKIISESQTKIANVVSAVADRQKPRALVIFAGMQHGGSGYDTVAANGTWNDILSKGGVVNAFAGVTDRIFADLSTEQLAAESIDVVILASYRLPDPVSEVEKLFDEFPQWNAAKNNRFLLLSDSINDGPYNDVAVERIARFLHPDAF